MPKILCFGDSNTYGFDPRDWFDCRYPAAVRWPDHLAAATGWEVLDHGENGREIPHTQWELRHFDVFLEKAGPLDCLLIMLGTNDILNAFRPSAAEAAARMERFLLHIREQSAALPLLLVAPVPVCIPDPARVQASEELCSRYAQLAQTLSIPFADAGTWKLPLAFDGVHLSEAGHSAFAEKIEEVLRSILEGQV